MYYYIKRISKLVIDSIMYFAWQTLWTTCGNLTMTPSGADCFYGPRMEIWRLGWTMDFLITTIIISIWDTLSTPWPTTYSNIRTGEKVKVDNFRFCIIHRFLKQGSHALWISRPSRLEIEQNSKSFEFKHVSGILVISWWISSLTN